MAGAMAKEILPSCGVPAGCGFAMALTKVYSLPSFDRIAESLKELPADDSDLDLCADDVALTMTGSFDQVADGFSAA